MDGVWMHLEGMGIKHSAQSSKAELNILFRGPQRRDTDSAISNKRGAKIKTIHASGVETLPARAANLPCKWAEYLYNATSVFCNPAGFICASFYVKNLETEGMSIMSFPVSSQTVVVATMESWQRYWWLHKQQQREEKCLKNWSINKQWMCLEKKRAADTPREHSDEDIPEMALFILVLLDLRQCFIPQKKTFFFFGSGDC